MTKHAQLGLPQGLTGEYYVIDPAGRRMSGMWLGFGRDFVINSGEGLSTTARYDR
jgi:hypothetical protein